MNNKKRRGNNPLLFNFVIKSITFRPHFQKKNDKVILIKGGRIDSPNHGKYLDAVDSTRRHMRRHPEAYKECGIFAETVFINK